MGTKNNPGQFDCFSKLEPDEPYFLLMARDVIGADTVRDWATERKHQLAMKNDGTMALDEVKREQAKIEEAFACADAMEAWRKANRP